LWWWALEWGLVLGSLDHPISTVEVYGVLAADGENSDEVGSKVAITEEGGPGGGSGGSLLLFLKTMTMGNMSLFSSVGGHGGLVGGGGGGGGRVHFHWSNIATGEDFVPLATGRGIIATRLLPCLVFTTLEYVIVSAVTMLSFYHLECSFCKVIICSLDIN